VQAEAQTMGATLVTGQTCVWLGGNDFAADAPWAWPDGEVFFRGLGETSVPVGGLYENFASTDPNHKYPEEHCVCFRAATSGLWWDYRCGDAYPYLCEAY
jgi:hypothetical protein